jgi:hypothetical protein
MPKQKRLRYPSDLNILGCFALLHAIRFAKPQKPSPIKRD